MIDSKCTRLRQITKQTRREDVEMVRGTNHLHSDCVTQTNSIPERFLSIETQKKRLYCSWQKWEHSSICSILSLNVASLHAVSKRNTRSHKIHCSCLTSYLKLISFGGFFFFFLNIQENQTLCLPFQNRHSFNIWIRTFSFPKVYIFFQKNTSKLDKRMCCGPL